MLSTETLTLCFCDKVVISSAAIVYYYQERFFFIFVRLQQKKTLHNVLDHSTACLHIFISLLPVSQIWCTKWRVIRSEWLSTGDGVHGSSFACAWREAEPTRYSQTLSVFFFSYVLGLLIENIRVASALTPKYGYSQYYTWLLWSRNSVEWKATVMWSHGMFGSSKVLRIFRNVISHENFVWCSSGVSIANSNSS